MKGDPMNRGPGLVVTLAAAVAATSVVGPASAASQPRSPIDGRWHASTTRTGLLRTGEVGPAEVGLLSGPWTATFGGGRFRVRNERTGGVGKGTFAVTGNVVRFVFARGVGLDPGATAYCTESLYRDRLTFHAVPGRSCLAWNAAVWTKVR
jgi:hypothetical protein